MNSTDSLRFNGGRVLFISDLHLSADRPDITDAFVRFLQTQTPDATALFILGDLFEMWLGDDDRSPFTLHVAQHLHATSQHLPIYFIHGNRDFAIGRKFATTAGIQLLPEQQVIDLFGQRTVLLHGDELCTGDIAYMKFRKKARGWWWPRLMSAIPLPIRRQLAHRGRAVSKQNQRALSAEIMDVTPEEVVKTCELHQVTQMIHGHTHRPGYHQHNTQLGHAKRIVLGDWYTQSSVLVAQASGLHLSTEALS